MPLITMQICRINDVHRHVHAANELFLCSSMFFFYVLLLCCSSMLLSSTCDCSLRKILITFGRSLNVPSIPEPEEEDNPMDRNDTDLIKREHIITHLFFVCDTRARTNHCDVTMCAVHKRFREHTHTHTTFSCQDVVCDPRTTLLEFLRAISSTKRNTEVCQRSHSSDRFDEQQKLECVASHTAACDA